MKLQLISPLLIILCASFTIGITYAPCYSSLCVEKFYPLETRIHIAVFYALLSGIVCWLALSRFSPRFRQIAAQYIFIKLPFGFRLTCGGLAFILWVMGISLGSIGYWLPTQRQYWLHRAELVSWTQYMYRVIWTAVSGHWLDIWIGLVFIPVGRNSVIGRAFDVEARSLLLAHKLLAYLLLAGGLVHGLLYYSFLAAWVSIDNEPKSLEFLPDNPTVTWAQSFAIGPFSWLPLPTGAIAGLIFIPLMAITSIPILRRKNFNVFYFTHVICAFMLLILISLHASTCFYFILPGLLLWVEDWVWRYFNSLRHDVKISLEDAGNGWYRLQLPQDPRLESSKLDMESQITHKLPSKLSPPLATYYLNILQVSRVQIHPFTASFIGTSVTGPQLLFQKSAAKKQARKRDREWTWRLAALLEGTDGKPQVTLTARIEGPYYPPLAEFMAADHICAIVGGTGVTGALSIARWWLGLQSASPELSKTLQIVWSVRDAAMSLLAEAQELLAISHTRTNFSFKVHISSTAGRLQSATIIDTLLTKREDVKGRLWIYSSGPRGLLQDTDSACATYSRLIGKPDVGPHVTALSWHVADYFR